MQEISCLVQFEGFFTLQSQVGWVTERYPFQSRIHVVSNGIYLHTYLYLLYTHL